MAEQTLETQLQESVAKYKAAGDAIHKFINGTDIEFIASESGNKPTIAKIVKDTQDLVDGITSDITTKSQQVTTDKATVEQLKTDTQAILDTFNSTHLSTMQQNTLDIEDNTVSIANKADKFAESIATAVVTASGSITYSENIKMVTKVDIGRYDIYLDDNLKGKAFDYLAITHDYAVNPRNLGANYVEGRLRLAMIGTNYKDGGFTVKVFPRRGEV